MTFWNPTPQPKTTTEQQKIFDDAEAIAGDVAIMDLLKQQAKQSDRRHIHRESQDLPPE